MGILHMMGQCAVPPGDRRGWIPGARVVGGSGANRRHPGQFFYDDAVMGLQLLEQARLVGIAKFVVIGTACAYLKFMPVPFQGADLWEVYPEETNAPYGLAKKMFFIQAQAYRQENTLNATSPVPVNLNGPGDNFDGETSPCHAGAHQKMPRGRGGRLGRGRSVRHRSIWG
jgi:nucleoside-diphosphate-sugar epimerase